MYQRISSPLKCLLFILALADSRSVPNDYADHNDIQNSFSMPDWQLTQGLENYDPGNNFGVKQQQIDPELIESPHVLKIPVPQPYPVHIPVKQHFTVPIFKLVPEEVERKVPIPVEKLVPIYKEKPVQIIVEKHHPVTVYKPYAVPVPVHTHIYIGKKNQAQKWVNSY